MAIHLIYGEEDYMRKFYTDKIIQETPLNNSSVNFIKITDETLGSLISNCEQTPFLDEKKIIVAQNTGIFANKKVKQELSDRIITYLENIPDYIVLIFNEESVDKRLSAYKKTAKLASVKECKYLSESDLTNFILRQIKKLGGNIGPQDATYLANVCGPSMTYIYSEVEKLAVFSKSGGKIDKNFIDSVCVKSNQGVVFDLTDAVTKKDVSKTFRLIDELIKQKLAEQFLLIMIYKQLRNMYLIKVAKSEGVASAKELGLNPYAFKILQSSVDNFTKEELKRVLLKLIEVDEKSKIGDIDVRVGLEIVLAKFLCK